MSEILFGSDNQAGVCREIIEAIVRCDEGIAIAYGDDPYTQKVDAVYSAIFERDSYVFSVATGTAANALGLAAITPPYGETLCHEASHILTTEGGAPEFYAGGSRLHGIAGADGKIGSARLEEVLAERTSPSKHHCVCSSLSITQPTELGTLYTIAEIGELTAIARSFGVRAHMDGARFANALAAADASPAEMSWKVGIDVLSLGTTKNGTMNAEAVIVFDGDLARDLARRQKRGGLLTSKMRYVSAQLLAYVENGLWLKNARHANAIARDVTRILATVRGVRLLHPVETNQIFADIDPAVTERLETAGFRFRAWDKCQPTLHRLVASFRDSPATVERVRSALSGLSGEPAPIAVS